MSAGRTLLDAFNILQQAGIENGHHLVDFGIGNSGHFSLAASRLVGVRGKIYAVDIMEEMLRTFDKRCAMYGLTNIMSVHGDFEGVDRPLPIESESVDFVTSVLNAACVENFQFLAMEAHRLLKPQGKLLIIDWKPEVWHPIAPPKHLLRSIYEAKQELLNTGFTQINEVRIGRHHWGLLLSHA
ncbi:methyltransferase domain-containing protein [Patescibacteria group bacterium]|nr:methyltransferase domain-containing protein [Patescibacteria group bacterium]